MLHLQLGCPAFKRAEKIFDPVSRCAETTHDPTYSSSEISDGPIATYLVPFPMITDLSLKQRKAPFVFLWTECKG